jgi:hypothetical protein
MIKKKHKSRGIFFVLYSDSLQMLIKNYQIRNTIQGTKVIDNRQNITVFVKDNTGSSRTQDPRNNLKLLYEKEN